MNNKKPTITNKYGMFADSSVKKIELMDFDYTNPNRTLAQQILNLKMFLFEELEQISDEYKYKNGFPESAVNQMLYFAYLYGKQNTREEAEIAVSNKMIKTLRDKLKDTMDMLDMIPAEESYNNYY